MTDTMVRRAWLAVIIPSILGYIGCVVAYFVSRLLAGDNPVHVVAEWLIGTALLGILVNFIMGWYLIYIAGDNIERLTEGRSRMKNSGIGLLAVIGIWIFFGVLREVLLTF